MSCHVKACCGVLAALAVSGLPAQEREPVGITLAARGDVQATDLVNLEERMLRRRSELFNVDRVVTASDARAQLRMEDDALISLRPGTELVIAEYEFNPETGEGKAIMELVSGGLRTLSGGISPANGNAEYELSTTAGSIGIRGTHYEIVDTDNGVFMGVWDGNIDVSPGGSSSGFSLGGDSDFSFAAIDDSGRVEFFLDPPEVFSPGGDELSESDDPDPSGERQGEAADDAPSDDTGGDGKSEEDGLGLAVEELPEPAQDAPGMAVVQQLMDGDDPPGLSGPPGLQGPGSGAPGRDNQDFSGEYQMQLLPTDIALTPASAMTKLSGAFVYSNPEFTVTETGSSSNSGGTGKYQMNMAVFVNFVGEPDDLNINAETDSPLNGLDYVAVNDHDVAGYLLLSRPGEGWAGEFYGSVDTSNSRLNIHDYSDSDGNMANVWYWNGVGDNRGSSKADGSITDAYLYGADAGYLSGNYSFSTEKKGVEGAFLLEKGSDTDSDWSPEQWYGPSFDDQSDDCPEFC